MKFATHTVMTQILDALFAVYAQRVPDVKKITQAMVDKGLVSSQADIINDHVAFSYHGSQEFGNCLL